MFFNYSNHSEAHLCSNTTERFDDFFQLFKLQDDLIFFFTWQCQVPPLQI